MDAASRPWLRHYDPGVPARLDYPEMPLWEVLERTAARVPERTCARFMGTRLSYRRLKELSDRFAAAVRARGIAKGDRVVLLLPNSPQFIIAYYGLLKAGALIVPLNPLCSARELTFHFQHSGAETAITIPLFLEKVMPLLEVTPLRRVVCAPLAEFLPFPLGLLMGVRERKPLAAVRGRKECVDFKALLAAAPPADFRPEPARPEEPAVLLYSGGTTGVAKGILLSHFNLVANAHQVVAWGALSGDDSLLAVLPLFHGFGMSVTMNAPILAGGTIVLMPRFRARDVAKAIQRSRPTFFIGVPTMFVALSNVPRIERYDLGSLKGIFVGAAPLTRGIKDHFEGATGGRMIEGYGLTEAVTAIMANPYHGTHKLGSIGVPFPDVDVKIVGLKDGRDLPPGELGEIVLKSPTVMLGYYNNPEETGEALAGGWLHTGDVGYMDEDGYFYITDRKKELIIVGGLNVFPREVDEVIYRHPKVKEGIAVGLPDLYKGERIKAYIVLKDGAAASAEELTAYFRENLAPYKVPSEVEFRDELPKSMIGKILRRSLQEEEAARAPVPTTQ